MSSPASIINLITKKVVESTSKAEEKEPDTEAFKP
jgi:hypothetical protein